ncbi:MAG: hypothetical protein R3B09_26695, partial [Nannocystaceae bacterium]
MVSPIARVKELQVYIDSLTEFVGGVALAWSALAAKDHAQYQKGLSGILTGAEALRKHLDALKGPLDELRAKSSATRSSALLASATMVREALVAYENKPADALVPAPGGDPEKPVPVGFAAAQRWVDLVSQIKSGEWAEAREREKWNEYAIAVFAFGPAGIVYVLAKEMGVVPDVGAAIAALDKKLGISEELEK